MKIAVTLTMACTLFAVSCSRNVSDGMRSTQAGNIETPPELNFFKIKSLVEDVDWVQMSTGASGADRARSFDIATEDLADTAERRMFMVLLEKHLRSQINEHGCRLLTRYRNESDFDTLTLLFTVGDRPAVLAVSGFVAPDERYWVRIQRILGEELPDHK